MERDLRHAMDLESPFLSPAMPRRKIPNLMCEVDDGNSADDEVSLEEDLSFPFSPEDCNQMAKIFGLLPKDDASVDAEPKKLDFFVKNDRSVELLDYAGQSAQAFHQDDIFQDIFELDEAELNLPSWLLPKPLESKSVFSDEVSTSFKALPTKLTIEAPAEENICSDQKLEFCDVVFVC